ncbi:hypothetical protein [Devosia neptuniae]|uniref:hypothetical protein n=1 Tax=Devosia TaxID=46913 RepID=UPI0022AF138C|nr:hypothetical protein [Devosia neptuniae]MCZ4347012.1 hypothetical protein [Devosia neptuniae]
MSASPCQTLWQVTLPMLLPGVIAGSLFTFLVSTNLFLLAFLLGRARSSPCQPCSSPSWPVARLIPAPPASPWSRRCRASPCCWCRNAFLRHELWLSR